MAPKGRFARVTPRARARRRLLFRAGAALRRARRAGATSCADAVRADARPRRAADSTPTSSSTRPARRSSRRRAGTARSRGRDRRASGTACSRSTSAAAPLTPLAGLAGHPLGRHAADALRTRLDPAAVHARTGAFLHPSFWPAKLAWLAPRSRTSFAARRRFVSFADYLYERLHGRRATSLSIASGTGLLDLQTRHAGTRSCSRRSASTPERLPAISDEPSTAGLVPAARRRRLLEPRRRLHRRRARGADGRHLGRARASSRDRAAAAAAAASSSTGSTSGASSRAARSRTAATSTPGSSRRSARRPGGIAERAPDEHGLTFLPFLGGERSTGWDARRRGAISGLTFETTPRTSAPGGARGRRLPVRGDRRPAAGGRGGRRDRPRPARRPRLDPDHGRRARAAGHRSASRRPRCAAPRWRARAARARGCRPAPLGETDVPAAGGGAGRRISFDAERPAAAAFYEELSGRERRRHRTAFDRHDPRRSRWTRCRRRTRAIRAPRWRSRRSPTCSTPR